MPSALATVPSFQDDGNPSDCKKVQHSETYVSAPNLLIDQLSWFGVA